MKSVAETSPQQRPLARLLELDVLRGLSIFMVLASHTPVHPEVHSFLYFPIKVLNRVGWSGVDVFFVLSGFLVGGLLMREYERTGTLVPSRFWIRRAFKVWPTFYVFLVAMFAFDAVAVEKGPLGARAAAAAAKYWPNWLHIQNYVDGNLGWLWSLAVEEHFYLLLPWTLTFVFGTRRGMKTPTRAGIGRRMLGCFAGIVVLCVSFRGLSYVRAERLGHVSAMALTWPTHLRIDSLFCGVFLAYFARFHHDFVQRVRPFRHLIFAASLLAWVPFYLDVDHRAQLVLYPWGLSLLYIGASGLLLFAHIVSTGPHIKGGIGRQLLRKPLTWIGWLGVRSYAIYVWHGFFAQPIARRLCDLVHVAGDRPGWEGWSHDAIYFASYIGLGAIMYELVERPGLILRQRLAPSTVETVTP